GGGTCEGGDGALRGCAVAGGGERCGERGDFGSGGGVGASGFEAGGGGDTDEAVGGIACVSLGADGAGAWGAGARGWGREVLGAAGDVGVERDGGSGRGGGLPGGVLAAARAGGGAVRGRDGGVGGAGVPGVPGDRTLADPPGHGAKVLEWGQPRLAALPAPAGRRLVATAREPGAPLRGRGAGGLDGIRRRLLAPEGGPADLPLRGRTLLVGEDRGRAEAGSGQSRSGPRCDRAPASGSPAPIAADERGRLRDGVARPLAALSDGASDRRNGGRA